MSVENNTEKPKGLFGAIRDTIKSCFNAQSSGKSFEYSVDERDNRWDIPLAPEKINDKGFEYSVEEHKGFKIPLSK